MQSFASAGGGPFLATPPSDGETYGVKNGDTWIEVCEEAPKNGTLYGRISNAWQPIPSGGDPGTASGVLFTPAGNISATNVQAAIQELDNEKVAKAGDTMTGFLTLHANPDAPMKAATKQYVDTALGTAGVTVADAAPAPSQGKMWWESDTGVLWMSYTDASSTQWIGVGGTTAAISDASKADKTYVDAQDAAITASVTAKADKTYVDSQNATQNTAIGLKADKTYVDSQDAAISAAVTAGDALRVLKAGDTMTGPLFVNNATPTTSKSTGALTVAGGMGVGENINAGGLIVHNSGVNSVREDSSYQITLGRATAPARTYGLAIGGADGRFTIDDISAAAVRLWIATTGQVTIATNIASTSPTTGALTVAGGVGIGGDLQIGTSLNINGSGNPAIYYKKNGTVTNLIYNDGGSYVITSNAIGSAGAYLPNGGTSWAALSDARMLYKRNARDITDHLPSLNAFYLYENKNDGGILEIFAKAQEFNDLFPHVIKRGSGDPDYIPSGVSDPQAWGMSYDRLGAIALAYLKQHASRLDALERRLRV